MGFTVNSGLGGGRAGGGSAMRIRAIRIQGYDFTLWGQLSSRPHHLSVVSAPKEGSCCLPKPHVVPCQCTIATSGAMSCGNPKRVPKPQTLNPQAFRDAMKEKAKYRCRMGEGRDVTGLAPLEEELVRSWDVKLGGRRMKATGKLGHS